MKLTEKQKNCPYCHEKGDYRGKTIDGTGDIGIGLIHDSIDGWHLCYWCWDVEEETQEPIVACPMCGRRLANEANRK